MNYSSCFTAIALAIGLCSCVSTPATRIESHPEIYNSLPAQERALVQTGQISEGMTPPAVYLAWGNPSAVSQGNLNGKSSMRWIYSNLEPVYTSPAPYMYPGGYYGPYHGYGPGWYGPGWYGPCCPYYSDITYVPVDTGYVLFVNGKVSSWEKRR